MRAVVYERYRELPTVHEVGNPSCPDNGVVIAVRATGVCRSDWHAWRGHDPVSLPHVPGHEFAGVISQTGSGVTRFNIGDRVTVPFVCGCGRCEFCLTGSANVCPDQTQPGFTGPGSFAEFVAVRGADVNLIRLPDSMEFVTAAALGCRFATAYRALTVHGRLAPGQWLAVFGCGGVGLSAVMIGIAVGARVIAIDPHRPALDRARDLGAELALPAGPDIDHDVRQITGGGAHVTLDAVGSATTVMTAVRSLRRRGRHVQVGLMFGADAAAPLPMDRIISRELQIYGSHGMPAVNYPGMLELIESGALMPERLVGKVIGLESAGAALAAMDSAGGSGMTVVAIPHV